MLVTLAGDVPRPGTVLEMWGPTPLGSIVASCALPGDGTIDGTGPAPGAAVLLGGYGGAWASLAGVWSLPVDREALGRVGLPLGCGMIGVLSAHACGLRETARLLGYLADESAGQCGPCALGLPDLADRARACRGHGICSLLLAARVDLDDWGFPVVDDRPLDSDLLEQRARRAVATCPRQPLSLRDGY